MNAQLELDSLILEDLEFETPCEGIFHGAGKRGHNPDQEATHFIKCPNCGGTTLVCAGRAFYVRNLKEAFRCPDCGDNSLHGSEWIVGRIPGK